MKDLTYFNEFLNLVLVVLALFIGFVSLVGGLRGKANPFYWIKNYKGLYLKTATHHTIFGAVVIVVFSYLLVKRLMLLGLF